LLKNGEASGSFAYPACSAPTRPLPPLPQEVQRGRGEQCCLLCPQERAGTCQELGWGPRMHEAPAAPGKRSGPAAPGRHPAQAGIGNPAPGGRELPWPYPGVRRVEVVSSGLGAVSRGGGRSVGWVSLSPAALPFPCLHRKQRGEARGAGGDGRAGGTESSWVQRRESKVSTLAMNCKQACPCLAVRAEL